MKLLPLHAAHSSGKAGVDRVERDRAAVEVDAAEGLLDEVLQRAEADRAPGLADLDRRPREDAVFDVEVASSRGSLPAARRSK